MTTQPNEFIEHVASLPPAEQAAYASKCFAQMSEEEQMENMLLMMDHAIPGDGFEGNRKLAEKLDMSLLRPFFQEYQPVVERLKDQAFAPLPPTPTDAEFIQAHLKVAEFEGPLLTPIQLMQIHPATTADLVTSIYRALRRSVDTASLRQDQVANLTIHLVQSLAKELRP